MKKSVRVMLGLFAVLLFLLGVGLLLKSKSYSWEGFENKASVTFYYLPGCGWCEKFKPEWEKFEKLAKEKGINVRSVNAQENEKEVAEKGIKGFPTVLISISGKETEYSGDRTAAALMKAVSA